jgi:hypothetical protein
MTTMPTVSRTRGIRGSIAEVCEYAGGLGIHAYPDVTALRATPSPRALDAR